MYSRIRSEKTERMLEVFQEQASDMYIEINEMKVRFIRYLLSFYQGEKWIFTKERGAMKLYVTEDGVLAFRNCGDDYCVCVDDLDPIILELSRGAVFTGKPSKDGYMNFAPIKKKAIKPLTFSIEITAPK